MDFITLALAKAYTNQKISSSGTVDTSQFIKNPTDARAGETLVVKTVDASGEPTAWETTEYPIEDINDVIKIVKHDHYFDITQSGVVSLKPEYRGVGEKNYPASIGDGTEANLPEKLVIPDAVDGIKVKALSPGMFCRNTRLNEVVLPNTISEIPAYCFAYATNLRAIHNTEHITSIGDRGVSTTRIKRISFPNLTRIEQRGLGYNGYLEVADIGNNIVTIPDKVFSHCSRLREVNGGLNVKSIGQRAFLYTRKLKDLPLLANVTFIGDYAFFGSRISTSLKAGGEISDKAFPTVDNVTDFWSGVQFSACQNRIITKLSQEAPAWKDTPVITGDTRTTYYKGCSVFTIMHIVSAITGKYYSSPEQFVAEVKADPVLSKYYSSFENWTGKFDNAAAMLADMGYKTEVHGLADGDDLTVADYKALVDAVKNGAYVYSQIGITGNWEAGNFDNGHTVVIYGINELGEVCVLDSAITQEPYRETGFEPDVDVYTYTMPYQNLVGPSSNFVIVYPPNVEPSAEDTGDYIPTPTTAEIGQTIVVKAVDDSGKPTEWEAADMTSDNLFMPLVDFTTTENVTDISIETCDDGESFANKKLTEVSIRCAVAPNSELTDYKDVIVRFGHLPLSHGYITLQQAMYNVARYFVVNLKASGSVSAEYAVYGDGSGKISFHCHNPTFLTNEFTTINGVYIRNADPGIPVGTRIVICGR